MKNTSGSPPKLAQKLLELFTGNCMIEDICGDLHETYELDLNRMHPTKAKLRFWINSLSIIFSYALKKRKNTYQMSQSPNTWAILKSYFTVGVRNLAKNKTFSILNMVGLSAGMSVSLLVVILLVNVWDFDNFQQNRDQIHRITTRVTDVYGKVNYATTLPSLADQIDQKLPHIPVTKINTGLRGIVNHQGRELELTGYFTDPQFLDVFTHQLISGAAGEALEKPNTIILTQKAANRFFGAADPIEKIIHTDFGDLLVVGVLADVNENSHMNFEALASYATLDQLRAKNALEKVNNNWSSVGEEYVYFLSEQTNEVDHLLANQSEAITKLQEDQDIQLQFATQGMQDIIFGSSVARPIGPSFPILNSILLLVLTLLILLPACFNYINLSIARALKRGKEVGLRKIVGSGRSQTVIQFLIEALIICSISVIGAMVVVWLIKDDFISMLASGSSLNNITISIEGFIFAMMLALFTALLAGLAPALYFSRLKPLQAIKSGFKQKSRGGIGLRKALIVFQFALTLGFLIGVFSMMRQYQYTLTFDMGFDRTNALVIPVLDADPYIIKSELSSVEGVTRVSMSSHIPGTNGASSIFINNKTTEDSLSVVHMAVDEDYLSSLDIKITRGQNISPNAPASESHVLVNEQFIKDFGSQIEFESRDHHWVLEGKPIRIIGVVENFNVSPLREEIPPLIIQYDPNKFRFATVTLGTENIPMVLTAMEDRWDSFSKLPMESEFLDYHVEEAMNGYQIAIKVLGFQGLLVIVISCLGLLGMVVFTTENRIKEIGIRKVMGASEKSLIWTIGKSFFQLLLIAAAVGSPIAYFLFNIMLSNMQFYSKGVGLIELLVPILTMLLIGGATVVLQTRSVAKLNPSENLRIE
ncbi:MAG: FtsX-like permease family protein [Cyclobacteriaceae bacterium]